MVERAHTAGCCPSVYAPIRTAGERIADWFAPSSDAATTKDHYEINIELPGISEDSIDVSVNDGVLSIKGE